ncbi:MAG: murein biosynthesis integral membrane protein MurJ [Coriobacteriia bacterium]|nr:murein biosynthesis integral membrane protein MurJ [Coriobacteriia bacterium]
MSVSTTVSRVTGFVRAWAIAYALGVTLLASSYSVANNIPNMIFELVAGGVLSSVFIPVFIERQQRESDEDAWRFASSVLNVTVLALGAVALVGTVWAEPFVRTQTFRIAPEEARLATFLFRFFAIQIVFYGAMAVFTGVLNSYRRFLAPAVAPIFNNVVVIVTLLAVYVPLSRADSPLAIPALAIGTTLGVIVMAAVQVPSMRRTGIRWMPRIDLHHPGVRKMVRMMGPTVGYVVINLVAISFRNAYAFETGSGGPAALLYAWMFYQLPYGIFAVALATAVFPELSASADRKDWASFKATFAKGLRATGALVIPMAAMLIALANPLITLYRAGRFGEGDVPLVAAVLSWWAAGLFFFAAFMFVLKTFYSTQDTKTPMVTNAVLLPAHIGMYAVLTSGAAGWPGLGLVGIPISDAVFYGAHVVVLALILRRRIGGFDTRGIASSVARMLLASLAGGLVALAAVRATGSPRGFALLGQIALAGGLGLGVSYGGATLMRVPEVAAGHRLAGRFARRILGRTPRDV